MPVSQATIPTASASRYLQQLCNHWKHKFALENTEVAGHIPFGDGRTCTLAATAEGLSLRVAAPDAEALAHLEGVVVDHLKRFAFREDFGAVQWVPVVNA